jgi:S1-C subfamily serine protease
MNKYLTTKYLRLSWLTVGSLVLCIASAQTHERPWLGVCFAGVPARTVAVTGSELPVASRVLTVRGPAARAGIVVGDSIVALDGQPIADPNDLICRLATKEPGDIVRLVAVRDHQTFTVVATLTHWPADQCAPRLACGNTTAEANDAPVLATNPCGANRPNREFD